MTTITCKRCKGTGHVQLAPALAAVFSCVPWTRRAVTFGEIRAALREKYRGPYGEMIPGSLAMRLNKLVAHGVLVRRDTVDGYVWSRE